MQFSIDQPFHSSLRRQWDRQEDLKLQEGINIHGKDWTAIVRNFFTNTNGEIQRSAKQCKRRLCILKSCSPAITQTRDRKKTQSLSSTQFMFWSKKEDQILFEGIIQFTTNWKAIAACFNGSRSDRQCYDRFQKYWKKRGYTIERILQEGNPQQIFPLNKSEKNHIENSTSKTGTDSASEIENGLEASIKEYLQEIAIELKAEIEEEEKLTKIEKGEHLFHDAIKALTYPAQDVDPSSLTHLEEINAMHIFWEKQKMNHPAENPDLDACSVSSWDSSLSIPSLAPFSDKISQKFEEYHLDKEIDPNLIDFSRSENDSDEEWI